MYKYDSNGVNLFSFVRTLTNTKIKHKNAAYAEIVCLSICNTLHKPTLLDT